MAWKPISERLEDLPVVIAGPILRRVEKDNVSVWLALKEPRTGADRLTLEVYDNGSTSQAGTAVVLKGGRDTVALGEHLHVVVLTAKLNGQGTLQQGHTYSYNVKGKDVDFSLIRNDICYAKYTLPTFSLPPNDLNKLRVIHASCRKLHSDGTDAMADIDGILQKVADDPATYADKRPHQLFLTGDQIYADDVDPLLLFLARDLSEGADAALDVDATPPRQPSARVSLLNWQERVPLGAVPGVGYVEGDTRYLGRLEVGRRGELLKEESGLHFPGEWEVTDNHLIKLGEFYAMYLLMWSPLLWPTDAEYPALRNVYSHAYYPTATVSGTPLAESEQVAQLPAETAEDKTTERLLERSIVRAKLYQDELAKIRRVLANVPTYMICDDHEITDDWFLDYHWCSTALTQNLGRRILQNGLTAYTLFQSWGNNPQQFEEHPPAPYSGLGWRFLTTLPLWQNKPLGYSAPDPNGTLLSKVGVPVHTIWETLGIITGLPDWEQLQFHRRLIAQNEGRLHHHFYIAWEKHEVMVLDTRTMRSYPGSDSDFAALISPEGLAFQLGELLSSSPAAPVPEVTFLVIATPISGIQNLEDTLTSWKFRQGVQTTKLPSGEDTENDINYFSDAEAYSYSQYGLQTLYAGICRCVAVRQQYVPTAPPGRIIVLSGDVHYGFTNRVEFWADRLFDSAPTDHTARPTHFVLAQLCASATKNSKEDFNMWLRRGTGTYGYNSLDVDGYDNDYLTHPAVWAGWIPPPDENKRKHVGTGYLSVTSVVGKRYKVSQLEPTVETSSLILNPTFFITPDWLYRITYLKSLLPLTPPAGEEVENPATPTFTPTPAQRKDSLRSMLAATRNNTKYLEEASSGMEAVGRNNFGEIFFEWGATEETKFVHHNLWWSRPNVSGTDQERLPHSKFAVLLGKDDNQYPKPTHPYKN